MSYRPIVPIADCPNCGKQPTFKAILFRGSQMRCRCGVSGPIVRDTQWPVHDARNAWAAVAGEPKLPRPPPPASMKTRAHTPAEQPIRRRAKAHRRAYFGIPTAI